MTLPNFLIVGAMKSGTTTLYADLYEHPDIFLTSDKEPEGLRWCDTPAGIERYKRLFARAGTAKAIGEASTFYTKRPYAEGLAESARTLLGPDVHIFYLVRDPIKRCISQFNHQVANGGETMSLNDALVNNLDYVNFSRYGWQIAPWCESFGSENIHILNFEAYTADRWTTIQTVCEILGVDPAKARFEAGKTFNQTAGKRVARGPWRWLIGSRFYRNNVRPLFPQALRDNLKVMLPNASSHSNETISAETRASLIQCLQKEDWKIWEDNKTRN